MATPAGYIDAADGGWPVETTELRSATYIPMDFFNQLVPPAWKTSFAKRERVEIYWQITIPAGTTLTIQTPFTYGAIDGEFDSVGADAGAWEEVDVGQMTPTTATYPGFGGFGDADKRPAHSWGTAWLATNDAACEVLALSFETYHPVAYGSSTPAGSGYVEHCGRNVDADSWRPYNKNEPASSWLARRILAESLNAILYRSRGVWSVPL